MLPQASFNRDRLVDLYRRYIAAAEAGDEATAADILSLVEERANQAMCMVELSVAGMADRDLEEYAIRLKAGMDANEVIDPAVDAAERETARVQLEVVEAEIARRDAFHEEVSSGAIYAISRGEIISALSTYAEMISEGTADSFAYATIEQTEHLVRQTLQSGLRGAAAVAHILRQVDDIPDPTPESSPALRWIKSAVLFEIMISRFGFGQRPKIELDPVTAAEARRAHRLFLALDRQDLRYEEEDWPLDLPVEIIASLVEQAELARTYWHARRWPEEDLGRYLIPPPREEPGRPEPSAQIVREHEARSRALQSGGIPFPMLYPLSSRVRTHGAEQIWRHGIPPLPEGELGWVVYGVPGDMRLHGGVFPHPDGLLVIPTIPRSRILTVGRPEDTENMERLASLEVEAGRRSAGDSSSHRFHLRQLLLRKGILAIARYDYLQKDTLTPQELILLDPSPRNVVVIRESVPSFVTSVGVTRRRSSSPPLH